MGVKKQITVSWILKNMLRKERVEGIEPSSEAWEAPALPLSYTREVVFKHLCRCLLDYTRLLHLDF